MNQLKYSIRSVDLFASWIRDIYIVTNGQVPVWLNTAHPRIKLITHQEIFNNQSHLPTFNSAAIESQLHHITGLSRRFLYFNDDVALLRPICLEDFYTKEKGYVLYPKKGKHINIDTSFRKIHFSHWRNLKPTFESCFRIVKKIEK